LVVMSVLVLFLVLTITYVLVATKAKMVGKALARLDMSGDPPNQQLDQIAMLLFRGTNDPHCPFLSWGLLEGKYGNVSFRGTISTVQTAAPANPGGQFLTITSGVSNVTSAPGNTPNYFKGCVLTMLNGVCSGLSTRIVASSSGSLTVMRFKADAGLYDPAVNDTFLVNGREYCGLGRGFDPTVVWTGNTPANDFPDPNTSAAFPNGWPYALLPNSVGFQLHVVTANGLTVNYNDPAGPGGDNPD